MRILILNRRDIANPAGGGAEIYTHEIARGLVDKYHCTVTILASRFREGSSREIIDGVRYLRKGNEVSVHLWGFFYALKNRREFDLIIDEFNGMGFFCFFFPNSILLIHQLYREFWMTELGLLGKLPFFLEPVVLGFYKNKKTITVSSSTKNDLDHLGFKDVGIVMNATREVHPVGIIKKEDLPVLIFLGRLKSTKKPQDAIEIFKNVKKHIPAIKLWIAGRGPEEEKLKTVAKGMNGITFWGWVDEEQKQRLLRRAHVLLVPSVREGFGINVIEAASAGTPAVGYDVPGLRDSIRNGNTGYLVKSIDDAASKVVELLSSHDCYEKMSANCLSYSKEFVWEKRVDEFWHKIC